MYRKCNVCGETKPYSDMVRRRDCKDGVAPLCRECKNQIQREMRHTTKDAYNRRYEKTESGYLMRTYRNMLSRVSGVLKHKAHLYEGLEILEKALFYEWSRTESSGFKALFVAYIASGFDMRLAPSIDRVDPTRGYVLDNMRWLTHAENSRLGALSRNMC